MKSVPKIGARIHLKEGHRYFPCTGTVKKIWPAVEYDDEGFDWENEEGVPPVKGPRPVTEWQVTMEVDEHPQHWSYGETKKFCPTVEEIELVPA